MITALLAIALFNCAVVMIDDLMKHRDLVGHGTPWHRALAAAGYVAVLACLGGLIIAAVVLVEHITDRSHS